MPRLVSGTTTLGRQHKDPVIPRKRRLSLVYRFFPRGTIIWNSLRVREKLLQSSIMAIAYTLQLPAILRGPVKREPEDERSGESRPIICSPSHSLLRVHTEAISPGPLLSPIPASIKLMLGNKTQLAFLGAKNVISPESGKKGLSQLLDVISISGRARKLMSDLFLCHTPLIRPKADDIPSKAVRRLTRERYTAGIRERCKALIPDHGKLSRYTAKCCPVLRSREIMIAGSRGNLAAAVRKASTGVSHYSLAGEDRAAGEAAWAARRCREAEFPYVRMEHKAALALPAEMQFAAVRPASREIENETQTQTRTRAEQISEKSSRSSSDDAISKGGSKPPAINISKLSDQVQFMIERKIKIDRERRGIYV